MLVIPAIDLKDGKCVRLKEGKMEEETIFSEDPIATAKVEELIHQLKENYTIIIVTHNMQQASRISDFTAFFYMGDLIEYDKTDTIFTKPKNERTQNYITGRFG